MVVTERLREFRDVNSYREKERRGEKKKKKKKIREAALVDRINESLMTKGLAGP